jgi:plastocyanin
MRRGVAIAMLIGMWTIAAVATAGDEKNEKKAKVEIYDDCDPADPNWDRTGGCTLEGGRVTEAEFNLLLFSPLSGDSIVGHPAWRLAPAYFRIDPDETVTAKNEGGRTHTFTEVANFGGGFVPPLNGILEFAPECATAAPLLPGASQQVTGLAPGNHLFQCCIHPWMRMLIKVEPEDEEDEEESSNQHHGH